MTEVDDAFRVGLAVRKDRKRRVERARAGMTEIVLNNRVTALQSVGGGINREVPCEATTADAENPPVP